MRFFLIIIVIVISPGCAKITQKEIISEKKVVSWEQRKKDLIATKNWNLKGKISIIENNKASTAIIDWKQNNNNFLIKISAPIGGQYILISKNFGNDYKLISSDGEAYTAKTEKELMEKKLGWYIPIKGFKYWVKGIPNNTKTDNLELDQTNRIRFLYQDKWNIEYIKYQYIKGKYLPTRITFYHKNYRIKLLIREWNI